MGLFGKSKKEREKEYMNRLDVPLCLKEGCVCVQSISYSLLCRYFRNAVLPADPALEVEILGTHPDRCVSCGAPIIKRGNRKKYCEKCAGIAYKRQQAEYARKKRTESKNRG